VISAQTATVLNELFKKDGGIPAKHRIVQVATQEKITIMAVQRYYYNHGKKLRSSIETVRDVPEDRTISSEKSQQQPITNFFNKS
jgi:hypothetical protein